MKIKEYEYVEDFVNMVLQGLSPACILVSEGGLGKSYLVRTICEEKCPDKYVIFRGHITPKQLFVYLFMNKNKIVIFDDIEDLLKNDKAVGILKSALWAVKGESRIIKYATTNKDGTPYHVEFEFAGGIILLLNKIPREHNPIVQALKTRNSVLEIKLTYKQKLKIMENILRNDSFYHLIGQELSNEDRGRLIKDLRENTSLSLENFNFRTMEKLVIYYAYNKKAHPDEPDRHVIMHKLTNKTDEEKEIVYRLIQANLPIATQITKFTEVTGKSRATFYRIKKTIENELGYDKKDQTCEEDVSEFHKNKHPNEMRQVEAQPELLNEWIDDFGDIL